MNKRDPIDEALVKRFDAAYPEARYSGHELGKDLDGISAHDVAKYRRDDWQWLTRKKRRAIQRALGLDDLEVHELREELGLEAS